MNNILGIWAENPAVSLAVWLVITIFAMYLARKPAHLLIRAVTRAARGQFRMMAQTLSRLEMQLGKRNREVTVALGKAAAERAIEREFERINTVVDRDLGKYPTLHRRISDLIHQLEEDYAHSTDTPPASPAWLAAIEAIAKAPNGSDPAVAHILENIQESIESAHKDALREYQEANRGRHERLRQMMPLWRRIGSDTETVKEVVDALEERSRSVDEQMAAYEEIRRGEDRVTRMLSSSSMTQFFISGLVLVIAILGGIINFQLIALPMSEMVGGTSQLGPMRTADVAALVIIMVEIAMGLFLMESLRITHLFPIIGSMDDKLRKRMTVITFSILFILACVEASLAYMRDVLALDREAITQSLTGLVVAESQFRWIPSIGQMVMGFILPFTLAFVAIPLESFIQSLRIVIGMTVGVVLRALAFFCRALGNFSFQFGNACIHLYDMIIMLPLRAEQLLGDVKTRKKGSQHDGPDVESTRKSCDA